MAFSCAFISHFSSTALLLLRIRSWFYSTKVDLTSYKEPQRGSCSNGLIRVHGNYLVLLNRSEIKSIIALYTFCLSSECLDSHWGTGTLETCIVLILSNVWWHMLNPVLKRQIKLVVIVIPSYLIHFFQTVMCKCWKPFPLYCILWYSLSSVSFRKS